MAKRRPTLAFDLAEATRRLGEADPALRELIVATAPFTLEQRVPASPYEALLEAIAYQSISGKAAATIFARILALDGGRVPSPERMLALRATALRKAGLSGAKVLAMKDLARKTRDGVVPTLAQARRMSDEELVERLVSVRGIGAWTVEMFLIFHLGRPDVLPVHDLGVKKGWSVAYGKQHMPTPKELLAFGERWRPYRTVASWYLWRAFERAGPAVTNAIRPPEAKGRAAARTARPAASVPRKSLGGEPAPGRARSTKTATRAARPAKIATPAARPAKIATRVPRPAKPAPRRRGA